MKTVRIIKLHPTPEEKTKVDAVMRVFSSMKRYAFNHILEGASAKELKKTLPSVFNVNTRYAEDAVLLAQSVIASQQELLSIRIEDIQAKLEKTERKIHDYQTGKKRPKKVDLATCLKGLCERREKLQAKLYELQLHQEKGTIPSVIFGGRKNFMKRFKGQISKQEWKDLRSNELYARGDKSKKGNLNIRLDYDENENAFFLEICDPLHQVVGQRHSPRIQVKATVPDKFVHDIINVVFPSAINEKDFYQPYTVQIKRKSDNYYAHLIFEEETLGTELSTFADIKKDVVAGIDINIDRIAVTLASKRGNFLESKVFYCHELEYARSNQRDNIVGEAVKAVFDWLLKKNVGAFVIENIKLSQQHDTNNKFNRLTHSFKKKRLTEAILRRGLRLGFLIKKVNPAYTSVIGRFKYSTKYGLSVHEAAAFVIARRGLGYQEKIPKMLIQELQQTVKPLLLVKLGSMEESEKSTEQGKKQRQYLGMLIHHIMNFKTTHLWSLWNVVHKTLWLDQHQIKLKEV